MEQVMTAAIFDQFGIELPVFQAPIGSIASPELAVAVCNAGGVGHLACTWRPAAQLGDIFAAVKTQTRKPFGANFVLGFPFEDRLAMALEHGVRVISFFWGDASAHLARVKASGALAMQVVGSVDGAKRAADAGFDVVVAQGREAGGHVCGHQGTMTLLPQVVDALSPLPVVAAGGIGDRRGVAAALALGAAGVWVGTRFLAAAEANIHPVYRDLVLRASGDDTLYSELFDVGWPNAPLRTLKNSTVRRWQDAGRPRPSGRPGEGEIIARRGDGSEISRYHFGSPTRDVAGDVEAMALYAGEAVGLVHQIEPAGAIVSELAEAFRAVP
jgi:nitronate monooxygenase